MKVLVFYIAGLFSLLLPGSVYAEIENIYVQVSPTAGTQSETYQLSVVIKGGDGSEQVHLIGGDNFSAQYIGPQSSVQIINGAMTSQVSYVFQIKPKNLGVLDSPGAEVESNGKTYSANGVKVRVVADDKTVGESGDSVFLKQKLSSESVFVGEQVVNELELYATETLYEAELVDVPFDGFWSVDTGPQEKGMKSLGGTEYLVTKLKKSLFPLSAGTLTIPTRQVHGKRRAQSKRARTPFGFDPFGDDFFGNFLGSSYKEFTVSASQISLNVKELPPPQSDLEQSRFLGRIVGATRLSAELSPDPVKVGDSKTLTITVKSVGNLNPLDSLKLLLPEGIRSYEEVPDKAEKEEAGVLVSQKTFRISLVFTKPGSVSFEPVRLAYFDPQSAKYRITTAELPLIVVESTSNETTSPTFEASSTPRLSEPSTTTKYSTEPEDFDELEQPIPLSTKIFGGLLSVAILTSIVVGIARYRSGATSRRIQSLLSACHDEATLIDLIRVYIEYYCNEKSRTSTLEDLRQVVSRAKISPDQSFALHTILDDLETYSFGNPASRSEIMERIQGRIRNGLITK